jgi:hypothetical protein
MGLLSIVRRLFIATVFLPCAHVDQGCQGAARAFHVFLAYGGEELGVNFLAGGGLRCSGCFAALGEGDDESAAILFVDAAIEIAARHQRVNELARCLFGDAEFPDEPAEGNVETEREATDDVGAVSGHVVEAAVFEGFAHGRAVGDAGVTEERGHGDIVERLLLFWHGAENIVLIIDSQYFGL